MKQKQFDDAMKDILRYAKENPEPKHILVSPKVFSYFQEWKQWWNKLPWYKKLIIRIREKFGTV